MWDDDNGSKAMCADTVLIDNEEEADDPIIAGKQNKNDCDVALELSL